MTSITQIQLDQSCIASGLALPAKWFVGYMILANNGEHYKNYASYFFDSINVRVGDLKRIRATVLRLTKTGGAFLCSHPTNSVSQCQVSLLPLALCERGRVNLSSPAHTLLSTTAADRGMSARGCALPFSFISNIGNQLFQNLAYLLQFLISIFVPKPRN